MADVVVVGKVTGIESQSVVAERWKGEEKVGHLVAIVRIEESLLGAKDLTHIRVGFVPEMQEDVVDRQKKVFR